MDAAAYKVLSGAVVQMRRLEMVTQDLANLNTSGYKGQRLAFTEFLARASQSRERPGGMVAMGDQRIDFSQGELKQTGNPFDLAIEGEGFFVIDTPQGVRYTRQGAFTLSSEGTVVTPLGEALLGEGGPIRVAGNKIQVAADGTVVSEQGQVGRVQVVRFADPQRLVREGRSLFQGRDGEAQAASNFRVLQGNLEQSNVNPIEAMVALISTQRQFEAYGRALQMMDSATARIITEGTR